MKTLEEVLQSEDFNTRLCVGDKWLVWCNGWVVYQQEYDQRTRIVLETDNKEEAIRKLVED